MGCKHYKRAAKMMCQECHKFYTCRFCHEDVSNHPIDRYAVEYMACMYCLRIQVGIGLDWIFQYGIISSPWVVNASIVTRFSENIIVIFVTFGAMTRLSSNSYPFLIVMDWIDCDG